MLEIYDLHCHSTVSDGVLSPIELVERATEKGVTTLALTDHDTISGLAQARDCARQNNINFINGVELSVEWERKCLHIVGLNIDPTCEKLLITLQQLQQMRLARAEKIAEKLAKKGIHGALDAIKKVVQDGMITRTHFADFLVSHAYITSPQEAFDYYLGQGKSAYVGTTWTTLENALNCIVEAGGVAVLAHPLRYKLTANWMKRLLTAFKNLGGQGIEVVTGRYNPDEIRRLADYAVRFELLGSVGSDFHNPANQWIELGKLAELPKTVKPIWSQF